MGRHPSHLVCPCRGVAPGSGGEDEEVVVAHYKTIADYMGWEDVGSVVAPGIWTAGSIKGTKYCEQAYQLGKNI